MLMEGCCPNPREREGMTRGRAELRRLPCVVLALSQKGRVAGSLRAWSPKMPF